MHHWKTILHSLAAAAIIMMPGCKPGNGPAGTASSASSTNTTSATNTVPEAKSYEVTGVVRELKIDGKTVVIKHDEIPGYMQAMTMPFEVRDADLLKGVSAGDRVKFRLRVTEDDGWIDRIEVVSKDNTLNAVAPEPGFRRVREVEPLKAGDLMPDYGFTNEFGKAFKLSDFRGKVLAFTFIFTRCPFPVFCPRMSEHFHQTYLKLRSTPTLLTNTHFLSITFDTAYDTPRVLEEYARRYRYDSNHWSFATGALIDIDAITEQFGLYFTREAGGINYNHNLRTVVVQPSGRIYHVLIGNEWKPQELADWITKAARGEPPVPGEESSVN